MPPTHINRRRRRNDTPAYNEKGEMKSTKTSEMAHRNNQIKHRRKKMKIMKKIIKKKISKMK